MESLFDHEGSNLEWVQLKGRHHQYQLQSGGQLLASLTFRSVWGTLATAETADGTWTFKRVGFLNPRITIRVADSAEDQATYHPRFSGGGTLALADGRTLAWRPANFWASEWSFSDASGSALLRLTRGLEGQGLKDLFKTQAALEVLDRPRCGEELPMLACLAFYLLILHEQDTAAVVAATASA